MGDASEDSVLTFSGLDPEEERALDLSLSARPKQLPRAERTLYFVMGFVALAVIVFWMLGWRNAAVNLGATGVFMAFIVAVRAIARFALDVRAKLMLRRRAQTRFTLVFSSDTLDCRDHHASLHRLHLRDVVAFEAEGRHVAAILPKDQRTILPCTVPTDHAALVASMNELLAEKKALRAGYRGELPAEIDEKR